MLRSIKRGRRRAGVTGAPVQIESTGTDPTGIESFRLLSSRNGRSPQTLRVLRPARPAADVPHHFLYALPVEPALGTTYGDGIRTLQALGANDQYNLTVVEPSFASEPWYADNPDVEKLQYESFMADELQPWVAANLATTGDEQHWLIGFSKSGIGGQQLILKHPDVFTRAASWDFPAEMATYKQFGSRSAKNYGSDANFQANYRLSRQFVEARKEPFHSDERIWIGAGSVFEADVVNYESLLTSAGIAHAVGVPRRVAHRWDSGWIPDALAALHCQSVNER
jgi:hypothetical protein